MRECVFDSEANGLLEEATAVHCIVFKDINTGEVFKFHSPFNMKSVIRFLENCSLLIGHNIISYDLPLLRKLWGFEYKGKKVDTLVLSRLQNPSFTNPPGYLGKAPHSVEAWGYRVGRGKVEHNDWSVFSFDMLNRCSEDVEIQHLIYLWLIEQQTNEGWTQAAQLTSKLFEILQLQEEAGWQVDVPYMEKCVAWLQKRIRWIDKVSNKYLPTLAINLETEKGGEFSFVKKPFKKDGNYSISTTNWMVDNQIPVDGGVVSGPFSRVLFRKINLSSIAETKDFLISEGWVPLEWNVSKTTGARTSPKFNKDDPFNGINSKLGTLIAKRVQCSHRMASIQGWLREVRPDGRMPARVTGLAATGRMKHAVIVNVPGEESFFGKMMRKCFIARDGYVLVGCDSAGCQNRMLAARVNDPKFTDILINGTKEDKTSIHYVNIKAMKEIAGVDISYHMAKTLNYAFMFGASDKKLGTTSLTSPSIGKKIREALLSISPGFKDLVESITAEWRASAKKVRNKWGGWSYTGGSIKGLDGRPILVESEHALLVYLLQSDEAIMMSAAYCWVYKRLLEKGYKWWDDFAIVCFYHDEFTIECREEIAEDVRLISEQCIVDAGKFYKIACPHEGDGKIGKNWYEIH